ncbi:MAG: hypothetical protein ACLQHF_00600 [Terracidiphilus sp.]
MKRSSNLIIVVIGGALAAFGISGFEEHSGIYGWAGWRVEDRIEIAVGVALVILGMFLRKESR